MKKMRLYSPIEKGTVYTQLLITDLVFKSTISICIDHLMLFNYALVCSNHRWDILWQNNKLNVYSIQWFVMIQNTSEAWTLSTAISPLLDGMFLEFCIKYFTAQDLNCCLFCLKANKHHYQYFAKLCIFWNNWNLIESPCNVSHTMDLCKWYTKIYYMNMLSRYSMSCHITERLCRRF